MSLACGVLRLVDKISPSPFSLSARDGVSRSLEPSSCQGGLLYALPLLSVGNGGEGGNFAEMCIVYEVLLGGERLEGGSNLLDGLVARHEAKAQFGW